jgi:hypothetical protein
MGIGRRDFLKMFGAALSMAVLTPTSAISWIDDYYVNRKLGIAFRKPSGWVFANAREMGECKAGQVLDLEDADLARELLANSADPILVITPTPLSTNEGSFTPGVTIFLEGYDDALEGSHGEAVEQEILGGQAMLANYQLLSEPRLTQVSNCPAYEYVSTFLFQHDALTEPVQVNIRVLSVYQKPALYDIRMYDSPYLGSEYIIDYDNFVESIRLI